MTFLNKNKLIHLIFVSLILIMSACAETPEKLDTTTSNTYCLDEEFKKLVETKTPVKKEITRKIRLTGRVELNPDNVVHFSNLVDGVIVKTFFTLGEHVTKGQVLAEVKSTELTEWQSRKKILSSELKVAQHNLEAIQSMYEDGISSKSELNKAKSEVVSLQSELEEIQSNLELYNASSKSGIFLIKSPTSGYIIEKNINAGMQIEAYGGTLFTIAKLSDVEVQINVHASDIKNIFVGMPVEVQSLSYPDHIFKGKVDAIAHVLESGTGVMKARVHIDNEKMLLKPGMFVDVKVFQETEEEAYKIPLSALIFDNNKNYVVHYINDCDIQIKEVDFISQNEDFCYVSLESIEATDQLITKEQLLIYEQIKNF